MITLVVEDGTGVANANTYADVAFARAYAETVGLTLPADDDAVAGLLLASMPYLEGQPWKGRRVDDTQALYWPRAGVLLDSGTSFPQNVVPNAVRQAQVTAASMVGDGTDLTPTIEGQFVKREKVGPIETEYSDEYLATVDGQPVFSAIAIFLRPYINGGGGYKIAPFGF